uniref:hypothetical protein n=1 Tax=Aciditerrimonas ferrireducens TaxID=667306 RepID=UPI0036732A33
MSGSPTPASTPTGGWLDHLLASTLRQAPSDPSTRPRPTLRRAAIRLAALTLAGGALSFGLGAALGGAFQPVPIHLPPSAAGHAPPPEDHSLPGNPSSGAGTTQAARAPSPRSAATQPPATAARGSAPSPVLTRRDTGPAAATSSPSGTAPSGTAPAHAGSSTAPSAATSATAPSPSPSTTTAASTGSTGSAGATGTGTGNGQPASPSGSGTAPASPPDQAGQPLTMLFELLQPSS